MNMAPVLVKTITRTVTEHVYSVVESCPCRNLSAKPPPMMSIKDESVLTQDWVKDFVREVDTSGVVPVYVPPSCKRMQEEFTTQRSAVMKKYMQGCKDQGLLPRMFYFEEQLLKGSATCYLHCNIFCLADLLGDQLGSIGPLELLGISTKPSLRRYARVFSPYYVNCLDILKTRMGIERFQHFRAGTIFGFKCTCL